MCLALLLGSRPEARTHTRMRSPQACSMATERSSSHSLFRARSPGRRTSAFMGVLEERRLLTTDYWTSATSGNWNDAQDGSNDAVPQAADALVIDVADANPTIRTSTTKGAHLFFVR